MTTTIAYPPPPSGWGKEGTISNDLVLAEREQCCRDVCEYCRTPEAFKCLAVGHNSDGWFHQIQNDDKTDVRCYASAIRERGAK